MNQRAKWTDTEDEFLRKFYHLDNPERLGKRLGKMCGRVRSGYSVAARAQKLGLSGLKSETDFGIQEAADALDTNRICVERLIAKGAVKTVGRGKCRFIPVAEFEKLAAYFPEPPERAIGKTEAMRLLGYSDSHITRLLQAGAIRGVKRGDRWFVDADHVEQLAQEMKRTGETRRAPYGWGRAPRLERARAESLVFNRARRAAARGEA